MHLAKIEIPFVKKEKLIRASLIKRPPSISTCPFSRAGALVRGNTVVLVLRGSSLKLRFASYVNTMILRDRVDQGGSGIQEYPK